MIRPLLLKGHEKSITQIAYNREGDLLFSASRAEFVAVWWADNGERIGSYHGHNGAVWFLDVSQDSKKLLTCSADSSAKIWTFPHTMRASIVVALLVFVGVALCAPAPPYIQNDLFPVHSDGIETVWLDDMSWVNEIAVQTFGQNNFSFYIYGDSRIRTVYPGRNFHVGATPNENWHLPFIDFHTFQNGTDIWGIGPINALYARNRTHYSGFQFEIAVITTKKIPDNPRGRIFIEQPLGFEGTFYSTRVVGIDINNLIGYFVGFYPGNYSTPWNLNFGVRRAHFNASLFGDDQLWNTTDRVWSFNHEVDEVAIYKNAQLVTYNSDFKPWILHARNVSRTAPVNSTWVVIVDPYANMATLVMGNHDPTVPLTITDHSYVPIHPRGSYIYGRIVSTAIFQDILFVGVAVDGQGTGWIDVLHLSNLSRVAEAIALPTNFSDPRALVLDYNNTTPTLYVAPNGGNHLLKIDINSLTITGYQSLPHYLHRTWRGVATHEHVYFVTNEQHSKVYRIDKQDFCPSTCMQHGFCSKGRCVCGPNLVLKGKQCQWKELVIEKRIAHKEKGGEVALGIFFAIATVAAAAGWYMVWKSRRGYQSVA
jgi:hypothetical protein